MVIFNPYKKTDIAPSVVEEDYISYEPLDEIDVDTQSVIRKFKNVTYSVSQPLTPQEGVSIYIGNLGYAMANHLKIEHGAGSFMIHHGNPFLDANPIAVCSSQIEKLEKDVEGFKAKLNKKYEQLKSK